MPYVYAVLNGALTPKAGAAQRSILKVQLFHREGAADQIAEQVNI